MMWPSKVYGKEIGCMKDVVELALLSSRGGARVWAFGASSEMHNFDVDTFTKALLKASDIPCKSFTIGVDGCIASARLVNRSKDGPVSPVASCKRKGNESRAEFIGQHMLR
ncbi:hypothetical protein BJY00DRAFT_281535 [Aspergillus carlsbadensis]|nr:hypothetical protein BJY00DRAFT_281535 [Aspergillus carlsbadensis]